MKLERGQIKDISEITGCSIQQIHRILNGERNVESRSGRYVTSAVNIMSKSRKNEKREIKKAMEKIDKEFNNK